METVTDTLPNVHQKLDWSSIISKVDFAFQPIVNISSGLCFGYEALLRKHEKAGFASINSLFDTAHSHGAIARVNLAAMEKAIAKFVESGCAEYSKLFLNIDNRAIKSIKELSSFLAGLENALGKHKLAHSSVCIEISEKHEFFPFEGTKEIFTRIRQGGFKIALDDFGSGYSGLQLLYKAEPDYVKIDGFFISDVHADKKKKKYLSSIINMSHLLGHTVIAEGVETKEEFYACKEMGCDLVQGYLVQRPLDVIVDQRRHYELIETLNSQDKRFNVSDKRIIFSMMEDIPPIRLFSRKGTLANVNEMLNAFRNNNELSFIPVASAENEPLGIVREKNLKGFLYSAYGMSLLQRKDGDVFDDLVSSCPISDLSSSAEKILELFAIDNNAEGILITNGGKYIGALSAKSLLRVLHEKNVQTARDQNPLTKLPGNSQINDFITKAINCVDAGHVLAYFDFDNFKPFNDKYGFSKGDEAILLFASILREMLPVDVFIGHIGGDDFFAGFSEGPDGGCNAIGAIKAVIRRFALNAKALYTAEDTELGYIVAMDRNNQLSSFPLLTVSAATLLMPAGKRSCEAEDLGHILADIKKQAKHSVDKIAFAILSGNTQSACEQWMECPGQPCQIPLE